MRRLSGALPILRARQWLHFLALPLAGVDVSSVSSAGGVARVALGIAAAAGALGYAYGLNAITDRASDASKEKNPLAGSADVPAAVTVVVLASAAFGAICSAALGAQALALTSGSLAFGTLYSAGPRLKSIPLVGIVANTLIFVPLLVVCAPVGAALRPPRAVLLATFIGLILQNQLLHEAADADEDARGRAMTTARLLGPRLTQALIPVIALVFALIALALATGPLVGYASVLALAAASGAAWLVPDASRARVVHRRVSAVFGAALFAAVLAS